MASVISDKNGRKRIQFVAGDRSRKAIRLGKATQRQANDIRRRVEQLILAATGATGVVDEDTIRWLAGLDEVIYDKLAAVGLVAERTAVKLAAFIDNYIRERCDVKPGTATVYGHTRRNLVDFFGADKPLRDISRGDADLWRVFLLKQGLSENTTRRRCGIAKQFFRVALRRSLVSSNPFEGLTSTGKQNTKRYYFITREEAEKVFDACPDAQWRLIFALSRYGGLRCPSEHLALKWADMDWGRGRLTVSSSKTEHHEGGESRLVPLFPELLPYLRQVFEEAKPGTEYVITRYRQANINLRTQLIRIIKKAGLIPWPKLFQNLRATRQTELCERWPEHVVCAWIGNSRPVARKHYLQVTDEHFEQALKPLGKSEAAQNPAQQNTEMPCTVSHPVRESAKFDVKRNPATQCEALVGDTGLEPVTSRV